jgi:hypothetical protein
MLLDHLDPRAWKRLTRRGRHRVDTAALEEELSALAGDYGSGMINRAEWHAARQGLMERLEAAAAEPLPLPSVDDVRAAWPQLEIDERRLVVAGVVTRLAIGPARPGVARFDVDRIDLAFID